MKKFNGFTLAEVLITLGIIGVVAAMTMPTLINQTNGAQYKAAYKKALSAISQGVTLNVALDDISFADTKAAASAGSTAKTTAGDTTVASLLASRMNVVSNTAPTATEYSPTWPKVSVCNKEGGCTEASDYTETNFTTPDTYLFFNDGSMIAFDHATTFGCTKTTKECPAIIDVNGIKGPNKAITNASNPTDIYPVVIYDQTILPASEEARAVLYGQ